MDTHPAEGSGGLGGAHGGEHGGDAHAPSDAPHAVEVAFLRRLDLGQGHGQAQAPQRATCLSAGLWAQHLLLGRDRVRDDDDDDDDQLAAGSVGRMEMVC